MRNVLARGWRSGFGLGHGLVIGHSPCCLGSHAAGELRPNHSDWLSDWFRRACVFDYSQARQRMKNAGPLPEGGYWIRPWEAQLWRTNALAHLIAVSSWRSHRFSLHAWPGAVTHGRGGFLIHRPGGHGEGRNWVSLRVLGVPGIRTGDVPPGNHLLAPRPEPRKPACHSGFARLRFFCGHGVSSRCATTAQLRLSTSLPRMTYARCGRSICCSTSYEDSNMPPLIPPSRSNWNLLRASSNNC